MTISYSNNVKANLAAAKITLTGNYRGTLTKNFKIASTKSAVSKLTPGKKKMTVYIKSQASQGVSGYQIAYKKGSKGSLKYIHTTSLK